MRTIFALILLLLLTAACQRERTLVTNLYVTHDGQVTEATPQVVRDDRAAALAKELRRRHQLEDATVTIRQLPVTQDGRQWYWQQLTVVITLGSDAAVDDSDALQQTVAAHLHPHLIDHRLLQIELSEGASDE